MPRRSPWLIAFSLAFAPALADPFASDWAKSSLSSARLVVGDPQNAGVEIHLSPGSVTYWRDPGDSGAPPTFDFANSTNLRSAEVVFPAPRRIVEADGSVAFGYDSDVMFPIEIAPIDASKPTRVNLSMNYAVCQTICLPARAQLSVEARPGVSSPFSTAISAARERAPRPLEASAVRVEPAGAAGGRKLCFAEPLGADPALFLEGPEGWRAIAAPDPAAEGCFIVKVVEQPAAELGPVH